MTESTKAFARYLPQGRRAEDWQLWCTTVGRASTAPGSSYPPAAGEHPPEYAQGLRTGRTLDEYQLVYVSRGCGRFIDGAGRERPVEEGSMLLVFPGVPHAYGPDPGTGWDEQWVGFRGPLADRLSDGGFLGPDRPVLRVGLREDLLHDYAELIDIAREERPGFQYELGAIVYRVLSRLACAVERDEQHSRAEELASRARAWMEARADSVLDTEKLAGELGLSYENFRRIFLRYTGLSPYRYFLQIKLGRAKSLLETTSLSIKEIASALSFENQYYFARAFKAHTGRTPSAWRSARKRV